MIPGFRELLHPLETPPFFGDCLQAQTRVAEPASDKDFLYKKSPCLKERKACHIDILWASFNAFFSFIPQEKGYTMRIYELALGPRLRPKV